MYYRTRGRRYRSVDYLMPFLIIICIGVIAVLAYSLWKSIFSSDTKGDAFMHIVSGNVQMRMWNTEEFYNLTTDALVMEGDEIKTSSDSRVIIEYFDGTIMRMDGGGDIVLEEVNDESGDRKIKLLLVDGKLWFNKVYKDTGSTEIVISMDNVVTRSLESNIFEVQNEFDEVVRVMHGDDVNVDVMSKDDSKVVETINIGIGQEVIFTDQVLEKYWQYQSPSVLAALTDTFKQSDWYTWNIAEDKTPTVFSKAAILGGGDDLLEVEPEVLGSVDQGEVIPDEEESEVDGGQVEEADIVEEESVVEEAVEEDLINAPLATPTVTSVAGSTQVDANGFYWVSSNLATITGTVSGAEKVVVSGYTLQKFNPGDTTWTYYANADYGLMEKGENTYEVYALGPNNERSDSIYVKVFYNPPLVQDQPGEASDDTSTEGTIDDGSENSGEGTV